MRSVSNEHAFNVCLWMNKNEQKKLLEIYQDQFVEGSFCTAFCHSAL